MKNGYLIPIHSFSIRVTNPGAVANQYYRNDFEMTENVFMTGFSILYANAALLGTSGAEPRIQLPNYVESVSFPDNAGATYIEQDYFTSGGNQMLVSGDLVALRPASRMQSIRLSNQTANAVIQYSVAFSYLLERDVDLYFEFLKMLKK